MTIDKHPDFELLQRYGRQADAPEFSDLRLHLASCRECRAQLDAMSALAQHYPWLQSATADEHQQQRVIDYIEQRLPQQQRQSVEQLFHDDPAALKSALHYASHHAAMQSSVLEPVLEESAGSTRRPVHGADNIASSLRRRLFDWLRIRAPLWLSIPATAVVVALLAIGLQPVLPTGDSGYAIVNYQDNPVIQFRSQQQLPGIGFFNRADKGVAPYGDVTVTMRQVGDKVVARTGYTGEDGYEIMLPADQASTFWSQLLEVGVKPCGLGARDTLRLEAGMNLYGSDMDESVTPLESALNWTVAWEPQERDFIGRQALESQRQAGVKHKLVGLVLQDKGVLRNHQKVFVDGLEAGEITSGSFSPTLAQSIAFARVTANIGSHCKVEVRNKLLDANVVKPPFARNGKACL